MRASDGDNIVTLDVTVTVTDENEPPEFPPPRPALAAWPRTPAAGENIGTPVSATDPDAGDTLTYSLSGTDAASFDIDTSSGQLQTKAALDKEAENSYTVTVSVRDSKDESGVVDLATDNTITVAITVTDANEAPEFPSTENGSRSIAENTPAGQNIGAPVAATDPDADATLTYSLSGTDDVSFDINTSTGQLRTKAPLDRETKDSYTVTVTASDGTLSDTQEVTITVADENEAPEVTGDTTISYAENREDTVAEYTATDPEKATIQWSLSGDDADDFSISGGVLTFATSPDYEDPADADTNNVYLVTIEASDGPNTVT